MNFAAAVAATTGEHVKLCCADDLLLPGALAAQSAAGGVAFDVDTSPGAAGSARALQSFRAYIDAFNRSDFDGFSRYYLPDIEFRGRGGTFAGREAVLEFYRGVKSKMRETLTLRGLPKQPTVVVLEPGGIAD